MSKPEKAPEKIWITWDDRYAWDIPETGGTEYVRADRTYADGVRDAMKVCNDVEAEWLKLAQGSLPDDDVQGYFRGGQHGIAEAVKQIRALLPADVVEEKHLTNAAEVEK
jgi:hypothetical protein